MKGRRPVFLIHGMCQRERALRRLGSAFAAAGCDVRSATLPAHEPASAVQVSRLSLTAYLDDLERQLARWAPATPPVLVGHSMGGLLAMQLAQRMQASALVLLTPAPPAGVARLSSTAVLLGAAVLTGDPLLRHGFTPQFRAFRRSALSGLPDAQQRQLHRELVPESSRAVLEMALWPLDWRQAGRVNLAGIRCPCYLVSAGRDRLTPPSVVRRLARLLPDATLRHWPGRSHMVNDDADTEPMVDEIVAWLNQRIPLGRRRR